MGYAARLLELESTPQEVQLKVVSQSSHVVVLGESSASLVPC
jgi:hypothetical protein